MFFRDTNDIKYFVNGPTEVQEGILYWKILSGSFPNHKLQIKEEKSSTSIKTFKVNTASILKGGHNQIQ